MTLYNIFNLLLGCILFTKKHYNELYSIFWFYLCSNYLTIFADIFYIIEFFANIRLLFFPIDIYSVYYAN